MSLIGDLMPAPNQRSHLLFSGALLAAIAAAIFLAAYAQYDYIPGRDSSVHVTAFYNSFFSESHWTRQIFQNDFQYGIALPSLTYPFWRVLGSAPATFGLVNLFAFFMMMWIAALVFKRLSADPDWVLPLGLLVLCSFIGTRIFLQYNLDGLYTLAAIGAFFLLIVDVERTHRDWVLQGTFVVFCLLVRLNLLIYLAVPIAYQLVYGFSKKQFRPVVAAMESVRKHRYLSVVCLAMVFLLLRDYLPDVPHILRRLAGNADFDFSNTKIVAGLWTWENWLWFIQRSVRATPYLWVFVSVPLAVVGWWKFFPGKRTVVFLFAVVPLVFYSFILGTRKVEYLMPSYVVWQLCAVLGVQAFRSKTIRLAFVAVILFLCSSQLWVSFFNLPPIPRAGWHGPDHMEIHQLVTDRGVDDAPGRDLRGFDRNAGTFLDMAFPDRTDLTIAVLPSPKLNASPGRYGNTLIAPMLEKTQKKVTLVYTLDIDQAREIRPDALFLTWYDERPDPWLSEQDLEVYGHVGEFVLHDLRVHAWIARR